MSALLSLADRVEAATGAGRELDALIAVEVRIAPKNAGWASKFAEWRVVTVEGTVRITVWDGDNLVGHWRSFAPYTASLDAAMPLAGNDPSGVMLEAVFALSKRFSLHTSFWPANQNYTEWLARYVTAAALRALDAAASGAGEGL